MTFSRNLSGPIVTMDNGEPAAKQPRFDEFGFELPDNQQDEASIQEYFNGQQYMNGQVHANPAVPQYDCFVQPQLDQPNMGYQDLQMNANEMYNGFDNYPAANNWGYPTDNSCPPIGYVPNYMENNGFMNQDGINLEPSNEAINVLPYQDNVPMNGNPNNINQPQYLGNGGCVLNEQPAPQIEPVEIVLSDDEEEIVKGSNKEEYPPIIGVTDDKVVPLGDEEPLDPYRNYEDVEVAILQSGMANIGLDTHVSLKIKDMLTMGRATYTNDEIVRFALNYISKNDISSKTRDEMFFLNSFFFDKMTEDIQWTYEEQDRIIGRQYFTMPYLQHEMGALSPLSEEEIEKLTVSQFAASAQKAVRRRQPIFEKKFIAVPICHNKHWVIAIIFNPSGCIETLSQDPAESDPCYIVVFDSLQELTTISVTDIFKKLAVFLAVKYRKTMEAENESEDNKRFNMNRIHLIIPKNLPVQENVFDCAYFALHYLEISFMAASRPFPLENVRDMDWSALFPNSEKLVKRMRERVFSAIYATASSNGRRRISRIEAHYGMGLSTEFKARKLRGYSAKVPELRTRESLPPRSSSFPIRLKHPDNSPLKRNPKECLESPLKIFDKIEIDYSGLDLFHQVAPGVISTVFDIQNN